MSAKSVGTPATVALTRAGVAFTVHSYHHDPAAASYGLEAATALGLDPAVVFKTLLVLADHDTVVAVTPVTGELDLKAVARAVGAKKARMAEPKAAERLTGMVVGGISPVGQRTKLRTVIDDSAADLETMYVSAGRRGFDLGLAPGELARITGASFASIQAGVSRW